MPLLLAAAALVVLAVVSRRRLRAWGATDAELAATYPDEGIVPGGGRGAVMATTLPAPPSAVWPWLVQMGCDRAGFYSWDRLDNGGRPSAETIHPEWQDLQEGGRILCMPDGSAWFDVARLEAERVLVLRSSLVLPKMAWFDPSGPLPKHYLLSTWGFFLSPTEDGGTRLVVTGVGRGRPRSVVGLANLLFADPAHWIMQTKQFAGLARRV